MSLQNNTINLQLILDKINNLPDVGTSGTGEFTVWGKYELAGDAGYSMSFGESDSTSATVSSFNDQHKRIIYADYAFDENTGVITLSNPLSATQSSSADQLSNYESYPYYYGDRSNGSTDNTVYKLTSITSSGISYSKTYTWNFDKAIVTGSAPSAGNFIEYIADRSASAYPDNGAKDGYWYIKVGTGSGSGDTGSGTVEITLQAKSATPSETEQTIEPDSGYDGLSKVTVSAISSTYVGSDVTKLGAKTYTPSTSAQTIAANQYLNGIQTISAVPTETKTIRENGTYTPDVGKFFSSITVEVPTGGESGGIADISTKEVTPNSNALSVEFSGLTGEPSAFAIQPVENITLSSTRSVVSVTYDGTETEGVCGYTSGSFMSSSATNAYFASNFTWEYENGTLTVTSSSASTSGYFISGITYKLFYVTGSASGNDGATEPNLQSKSVTPSETAQTITPDDGYDGLSQVEVEAVPTETKTITESGTYVPSDGKFFSQVTVNLPTSGGDSSDGLPDVIVAGDTPILGSWTGKTVSTTTITDTGLSVTIPKNGTYRLYIPATKGSGMGSSGNPTITVYKNGVATDYVVSVTSTTPTTPYSIDVECAEGDVIGLYATGYKASYSTTSVTVMALIACIDR